MKNYDQNNQARNPPKTSEDETNNETEHCLIVLNEVEEAVELPEKEILRLLPAAPTQPCKLWARVIFQMLGNRSAASYEISKDNNSLAILPTLWRDLEREDGLLIDFRYPPYLKGTNNIDLECCPIIRGKRYAEYGISVKISRDGQLLQFDESRMKCEGDNIALSPLKSILNTAAAKEAALDEHEYNIRLVHSLMRYLPELATPIKVNDVPLHNLLR